MLLNYSWLNHFFFFKGCKNNINSVSSSALYNTACPVLLRIILSWYSVTMPLRSYYASLQNMKIKINLHENLLFSFLPCENLMVKFPTFTEICLSSSMYKSFSLLLMMRWSGIVYNCSSRISHKHNTFRNEWSKVC